MKTEPRRAPRVLFASLLLLIGSMTACARTPMLYPAPAIPVPSPPPPPLVEVAFELPGVGTVSAWHWPQTHGEASDSGPVLAFFHGNGENLETLRLSGTLAAFAELGFPYLAVDYPGYGRSSGKASETALVDSAVVALEWMRRSYPGRPLVVAGWSLGAAVAMQAAVRAEVDGLVVMSAWTSLEEIGRTHFPGWLVGMFVSESYDSQGAAPKVTVPTLVIHGGRDEIIPIDHGRRIAAGLPDAHWVEVEGAGHNDLLGRRLVWDELRSFLGGF